MGSIAPIREGSSRVSGRVSGAVIGIRDVTNDRMLESQYQQVRHLAALQRLAGGIAHNLNSVLPMVSGYTESLLQSLDSSDPHLRDVKMIEEAAEKASVLTRQLLAFSRRQRTQPELLDLNDTIESLKQVLEHCVGAHIQIEMKLEPQISSIEADPLHIEQIVMSLVFECAGCDVAGRASRHHHVARSPGQCHR